MTGDKVPGPVIADPLGRAVFGGEGPDHVERVHGQDADAGRPADVQAGAPVHLQRPGVVGSRGGGAERIPATRAWVRGPALP